jgi:phospholipid/cholesterol/gamma-HCH transport system substrate-binding protein
LFYTSTAENVFAGDAFKFETTKQTFMVTKSQKIRLGIFIIISNSIILIALAVLSYDMLFSQRHIYYIAYSNQSLSGVDIGSQVKYLGIPVGSVRDLHINPYNLNEIIVTVAIDPDIPIREDVEANLIAIGITGIKIIELTAGTQQARELEPGSYIQPGKSVTDEFVQRAVVITEKIESVLDNMLEFTEDDTRMHIVSFIEEAHTTILKINRMLDENHERLEQIVTHADTLAFELNEMVVSLNKLVQETGTIVNRNQRKIDDTIDDLKTTVRYLNYTARMVNSDPSVLIRGTRPNNPPDDRLRNN